MPTPHSGQLLPSIVTAVIIAFVLGLLAARRRLRPLVGYLLAGVAIGPFTPGFVGDTGLAQQFVEIGVILLMFEVGLHLSVADLAAVRPIAVWGALAQIAVSVPAGVGLALAWGWTTAAGSLLGLASSVASTVVVLRMLAERHALDDNGRLVVGWLIVQDLVIVLVLVLLPTLAGRGEAASGFSDLAAELAVIVVAKVALFGLLIVVGKQVVPKLLEFVARAGSRELFTLSLLAIALGIAYGLSELFGVSFTLGAFFAGVVLRRVASTATRSRQPAAARRLRGPVLRLGRDAVRPGRAVARAAPGRGRAARDRRREVAGCSRGHAAVPPAARDRAARLGGAGADRRVLVHPRRPGRTPGYATAGG